MKDLGVLDWGYTEEAIPRTLSEYEAWTEKDLHGPLNYLNDHRKNLRRDLRNVFPEFQSALVFLFSYQETKKWMLENNQHSVAAYTLGFEGEDYHRALKERLTKITEKLAIDDLKTFFTIDAQPVLERDLAYRAGLGWFGKNSMLINRKEGSYFIIGSILLNQRLPIDQAIFDVDHCGQCTACIDACPTSAINVDTRTLEASKCISTFTIEIMKDAPAPEGFEKSRGEIFGCDICQDVCPWNRKPLQRITSSLKLQDKFLFIKDWLFDFPREKLKTMIAADTNRGFRKKLFGTAFDRPGKEGWLKNFKR
ncbi:tRNA epoxyqueuosine(34) reductase QueG [Peredibacter sp. HCB2-198]|uniref:tRNA epoxyqueuosine(34) reductase QueG n=1 Tax=Peredibacter sp. HCB2-198 TaxID=3383025 RepID=UPI0038B55DD7